MSHGLINIYMNNPWNKKNIIDIIEPHKANILKYIVKIQKIYVKNRKKYKMNHDELKAREYLESVYNNGYGIRTISNSLGISHNTGRLLLINWFKIKTRKGLHIVTEQVKKFRSERVKGDLNPWFNWPMNGKIRNSRGIQGYYIKKSGEYIWLRSSWEYIYAKWLDNNDIEWKFERNVYKLLNGENYLPDFFIYENGKLKYVVEMKGYNKSKIYKSKMFENEYKIKTILIESVEDYCEDYHKELKTWKNIRLLEKK